MGANSSRQCPETCCQRVIESLLLNLSNNQKANSVTPSSVRSTRVSNIMLWQRLFISFLCNTHLVLGSSETVAFLDHLLRHLVSGQAVQPHQVGHARSLVRIESHLVMYDFYILLGWLQSLCGIKVNKKHSKKIKIRLWPIIYWICCFTIVCYPSGRLRIPLSQKMSLFINTTQSSVVSS